MGLACAWTAALTIWIGCRVRRPAVFTLSIREGQWEYTFTGPSVVEVMKLKAANARPDALFCDRTP